MGAVENLACPDCGGPMVSRLTTPTRDLFGSVSRRFWGCARYPACRGTRDTDGLSRAERDAERRELREAWDR